MAHTLKPTPSINQGNAVPASFNETDKSLSIAGFITAEVGRKVTLTISTTTVASDSESYAFTENGIALYTIKVIYTDGTRALMLSAERIA